MARKGNLRVHHSAALGTWYFDLKLDPKNTVMGNASPLLDVLKNRSTSLRREYRDWRDHEFLPLYEYNATMRDVRVMQIANTLPDPATIEVEAAPSIKCLISGESRRRAVLCFEGPQAEIPGHGDRPYIRIYEGDGEFIRTLAAFQCTTAIRKLVIEADANEQAPFKALVRVKLSQTSFFLEQPFPLYFNGGVDEMHFYKDQEAKHILEVVINPGIKLSESKVRERPTLRRIEIAIGALKPPWMK